MAWHPFRNVGLKIVSLGLGTLLWVTVSGHQVERRVLVPVSYSNVPAGLEMTSDQDDANVHLRGDDKQLSELGQGSVRVIVDLSEAHPGTNVIPLRVDEIVAPLGVEILQVEPETVIVALEKSGSQEVAVEPTVEGQPAVGYVMGTITVEPKSVTVVGPVSQLQHPISVVTEPIQLDGRMSTVVTEVSVRVVDSEVRIAEPHRVRVVVRIDPERAAR